MEEILVIDGLDVNVAEE